MHLRKLTLGLGILGALVTNFAHALGLGEITLNSALNEPLNADIKLLQVRDLQSSEIIVRLATNEDFQRAGVDRVGFLLDLDFDVQFSGPNGPFIKVTSDRPVQEPYLNFLVQLEWPSGRLLREYTVLLDLPVYSNAPTQPVQPAQTQTQPAPQPRVQPAPAPAPVQPTRPQTAQPQTTYTPPATTPAPAAPVQPVQPVQPQAEPEVATYGADTYGPVQSNDTLWEIALRVRPSRSASVHQTMLALQRLNPDAFINDNINLLKKGQVLRVPTMDEIDSLQQSAAVQEVARQNTQWAGASDSQPTGAELDAAPVREQVEVEDEEPRGQLTLAAPGDTATDDRSGTGADNTALEGELNSNMELLDSARRESDELNSRISELDEQVETIERLLEVSNAELSNLQNAAQQTADDAVAAANAVDDISISDDDLSISDDLTISDDLSIDDATDVVEDAAESVVDTNAEATAQPEPQPAPAPVIQPPQRKSSFMDIIMDNLLYIGAGLLVLLLAIGGFLFHRKTQNEMAEFDALDDDDFYEEDEEVEESAYEEAHEEVDDELDFESEPEDLEEEVVAATESETGDAVAEADIYIAYGKFDQAEEMLQRALIEDPNNAEARLKLLEVYAETKDTDKFDAEYGQLLATGDNAIAQRAEQLRNTIPGIGAFAGVAAAAASTDFDFSDSDLDLGDDVTQIKPLESIDDISLDLDSSEMDFEAPDAIDELEENLDFSLEGDTDLGGEETDLELTSGSDDVTPELGDLDLSLDLDSSEEEVSIDADDLSLDLDLESDEAVTIDLDEDDGLGDISLDLDEPAKAELATEDSDFLSDLEFSASAASDAGEALTDAETSEDDLDDAFDFEMGDVDLAALDKEMDDLVGDIDEIDEEVPTAPPTGSMKPVDAETLTDLEVDLGDTTDLDDMISLDDSSLDDLNVNQLSEPQAEQPVEPPSLPDYDEEDSELDFLGDTDEVATKLDLARAYIDMGDKDGAKDILDEIVDEGNDAQKQEAQELLGRL